jgi:hypothetical protein
MGETTHTYDELKKKTVDELRDIAKDIQSEEVRGFSTMHKSELLPAICKALNIEVKKVVIEQSAKQKLKAQLREIEKKRDKAMEEKNYKKLAACRDGIHNLKRMMRKPTKAVKAGKV